MAKRVQKLAKAASKAKRSGGSSAESKQESSNPCGGDDVETKSTNTQSERVCILVLGMHRSGTSALTRIVSLFGPKLPRRLMGAGSGNEVGHWEPSRLVEYHDQLLAELGSSWHDWRPLDLQSLPVSRRETIRDDIREILREDFRDAPAIIVKDPRICRFAGLFSQALLEEGYRTHVILPFRNPLDVIDSLMARKTVWPDELGFVDAALLWLIHNLEAAHFASGQASSVLSFEALSKDWRPAISSLIEEIDDPSTLGMEEVAQDIETFFDEKLRNHKRRLEDLLSDRRISGWILETFNALKDLEAGRNVPAAYLELERIRKEFGDALPLLEAMSAERQSTLAELSQVSDQLGAAQSELSQVSDQLGQTQSELSQVSAVSQDRASALHSAQEELAQVEGLLRDRDSAVETLQNDIALQRGEAASAVVHLKDQYERSTSWRITAPLRRVASGRIVRGLARLRQGKATSVLRNLFNQPNPASSLIINEFADRRSSVVGSAWHVASYRSRFYDDADSLPAITLSAVTYNSSKWVQGFIDSLVGQNYPIDKITLHIVDNGSTDETLKLLSEIKAAIGDKFRDFIISSRPNNGYGMGNDYVIRQSTDDFVLVSNVDLKFTPTSLTSVVGFAYRDEGTVGSWELRQQPFEHPKYYDPVTLEAAWSSHACILFRRSAYLQVGGYEPQIFMYGEDVELSYRLRSHGFALRYVPWATVTHYVDLEDTSVRPHQLSGSLAANVLLRQRYGGRFEALAGQLALRRIAAKETDPGRLAGMHGALEAVSKKKKHFRKIKPSKNFHFPFSGFDYHLSRPGHDSEVQVYSPGEPAPLVTVITRTHGPKIRYLREAIGSVLNQTYPNIEHIIVEDRTQHAGAVVDEVKSAYGANIRYLHSTKTGRSPAGNLALSEAQGEYIMMLDNDDLLFADHVEQLVRAVQAATQDEVAAYSLGWELVTETGADDAYREISHNLPAAHTQPYSKDRLSIMNYIPIQSILFHRSLYEDHGGFDEDLEYLEDWNLWVRFSQSGDFVHVPKLTSMYRTPADPSIRQERQQLLDGAYAVTVEKNSNYMVKA